MAQQPKRTDVDAAIAALDSVRGSWMRRPGVTATDVGYKLSAGEMTDQLALRVHVERKRPLAELAASEVFNGPDDAEADVGGFPVDVIEATYEPSDQLAVLEDVDAETVDRRARTRPLIGGISVGNPRVTAGTLGAIVYDRVSCKPMILSNFHVLAGARAATAGESVTQPGRVDGGTDPTDRVGTLSRMRLDTAMDAAVAMVDAGVAVDREVLGIGTVAGTTTPSLGMAIVKSGRTTGNTAGVIDGVSMSVSINYGGDVGAQMLNNQFHIVPRPPWPSVNDEISSGGDSGSVWIEEATRLAVGLHFAGETGAAVADEFALANPIQAVATALNFSFLPVLCFREPRPFLDICRRYPALCKFVRFPQFPVPIPDPRPWPPVGPIPGPGPFTRLQAPDAPAAGGADGGALSTDEGQAVLADLARAVMDLLEDR